MGEWGRVRSCARRSRSKDRLHQPKTKTPHAARHMHRIGIPQWSGSGSFGFAPFVSELFWLGYRRLGRCVCVEWTGLDRRDTPPPAQQTTTDHTPPFPACHSPLPLTTYHCGVGLLFAFVSLLCAGFSLLRIPAQNGRAVIADSCPTAMCIIPHPNTLCACMSYICTTPGTCMQIRTRHDVSCTPKRHHFSWRAQNGRTRPSVRSLQQH